MRTLATANILVGNLSAKNRQDLLGDNALENLPKIGYLNKQPYIEVGYGVENIFRLLRIDFIHRLSYLKHDNVSRFGVKASVQFKI